ncbi:MAG: cupin domain-containing protein [Deltaproteobacteria bacterium]|nr:cupin domain-containing protein [Deltaproteobacteria bacterium]
MADPTYIVRGAPAPDTESSYPPPFDAEKLSRGRDLGGPAGAVSLGAWHETLDPGRRTSFTHAHSHEEEVVYVLTGRCVLRALPPGGESEEHTLEAGDFAAFAAGTGVAHTLANRSDAPCTLLVVGEKRPEDKVFFPEDKVFDAWHREHRPQRHWDR